MTIESTNTSSTTTRTTVWEGLVSGQHWIARVVDVDANEGLCSLCVVAGEERDAPDRTPNCVWDYQYDHFPNRFASNAKVPAAVTSTMRDGLRAWFSNVGLGVRAA